MPKWDKAAIVAGLRNNGYGSESTKINLEQIFKLLSLANEVKSI